MREIKFRAWDKRFNKMYYTSKECTVWMGGAVVSVNTPEGQVFNGDVEYGMQYTGLLDKNGTEIYEGDIFTCKDQNYTESVIFLKGCFVSDFNKIEISNNIQYENIEIIGNIYEDPELLKG